jgi:uncharacterized protein (TIGR02271 family)
MTYQAQSGGTRSVTAFFDERDDAEESVESLAAAGIARDRIRMVAGEQPGAGMTAGRDTHSSKGFWDSLADLFMPDEDRYTYAEGLRRGGYLVTVTTTDGEYEQALDILDDEGTIDIDERASSWRSEGWEGYQAGSMTAGGMASSLNYADRDTTDRLHATGDEEVIPVAEEALRVGKRDVSHGRVRVRSYIVETPVSESIELSDEHVNVERRPVDRLAVGNEPLFQDRTIEIEERGEEAVVAKEARVREELVVNKERTTRRETVSDTVRHTEVEIEDGRTDMGRERLRSRR